MIIELLMKTGFDEMETLLICQLGTFRTGAVGELVDGFSCAISDEKEWSGDLGWTVFAGEGDSKF